MDTFVFFRINRLGLPSPFLCLIIFSIIRSLSPCITRKFFKFRSFVKVPHTISVAFDYDFFSFQDSLPVLSVMLRRAIKRDIAFNPSRENPSRLVGLPPPPNFESAINISGGPFSGQRRGIAKENLTPGTGSVNGILRQSARMVPPVVVVR